MEILYVLLVLLVVTRSFGELAERVGQPALVGELLSGVAIGLVVMRWQPVFPVLSELDTNSVFRAVTDLGIFFLMLLAGVEMRPHEVGQASKRALLVAFGGMILPLALGGVLGWLVLPDSPFKSAQVLFLGVALAVTAVPVSIRVLMDFGRLDTAMGQLVVSAAIFDDVLSLVLLAALTAIIKTGSMPAVGDFALLLGQTVLFFAVTFVVGHKLLPLLGKHVRRLHIDEFEFTFLLIIALGFAVLAESLGMHFIIGAFVAGLYFSQETIDPQVHEDVQSKVKSLSTGFLAPIFFASIGLHFDPSALLTIPGFSLALIVLAVIGKMAGAALPAWGGGLSGREALAAGVCMNARGAVELIIADIALQAGLFSHPTPTPLMVEHMFSAVVLMAIVTTLFTPVALARILKRP